MSGHKTYSQEFKSEAVKLVTDQGLTPARVARDLGVDLQTIRRWLQELAATPQQLPVAATLATELARLRREVELLRQERDILKKPSASSRGCHNDTEVSVHRQLREPVPDHAACRVLELARSGSCAWRTRSESPRRQADRCLSVQIAASFRASRHSYGSPRVHADLHHSGVRCARKRVARLMRQAGLRASAPRRRVQKLTRAINCWLRRTCSSSVYRDRAGPEMGRRYHVPADPAGRGVLGGCA